MATSEAVGIAVASETTESSTITELSSLIESTSWAEEPRLVNRAFEAASGDKNTDVGVSTLKSTFWLARNEFINRTVIVATPLEAIATYSIEKNNPAAARTIYLSAAHSDEIPKDLLRQSEKVYLSASCNEDVQIAAKAANPNSYLITLAHENG